MIERLTNKHYSNDEILNVFKAWEDQSSTEEQWKLWK